MAKQEIVYTLEHVADAIGGLAFDLPLDPNNDFGMTVGDELHNIDYNLSRIADSLEELVKIVKLK